MSKALTIGVLALQGAFKKHLEMLQDLGVQALEVRKAKDLKACHGLIIPGGESTTMKKQMEFAEMVEPLEQFAKTRPMFGTCAGLILMSNQIIADAMEPLHILNLAVERNAFGRQVESFQTDIEVSLGAKGDLLPAVFIRAPRIRQIEEGVSVLASYEKEPVLVQQGFHLGATFHPELTESSLIHAYFVRLVKQHA